jgi:caa(3)-type oxidase subunit IV
MQGELAHRGHTPAQYVRIWVILLGLLVISICGPMFGIRAVTLITGFGIAVVKALLVAAFFMHLNIEKRYIVSLLVAMLLTVGLYFVGTAPEIMLPEGQQWRNEAAQRHIEQHKGQPSTTQEQKGH